ncbi:hypothetical protein RUM43_009043 [Polyplax serrata]|uniref:Secreted protein n=1 Tax=Polyplax serrata TaxID=468196 RepID=A0AAN8S0X1_POLSC
MLLLLHGVLLLSDKAAAAAAARLLLDMMAAMEKSVARVLTEGTTSMAAAAVGRAGVASCTAPKIIVPDEIYLTGGKKTNSRGENFSSSLSDGRNFTHGFASDFHRFPVSFSFCFHVRPGISQKPGFGCHSVRDRWYTKHTEDTTSPFTVTYGGRGHRTEQRGEQTGTGRQSPDKTEIGAGKLLV